MTDKPNRRGPLTRDNSVLLLVDHQVGLYTGVRDIDTLELKHNVVGMTKALRALKIPVVVTTTTEKMWGPLIPELAEVVRGIPTAGGTAMPAPAHRAARQRGVLRDPGRARRGGSMRGQAVPMAGGLSQSP